MTIFGALGFFVFGTIIGSFLNVVILRFHTGVSLGGRSGCFSCGKKIPWHDLVPILSFLRLRGRCRSCRSKLSVQYPLVEFITGLLFLGVFFKYVSSFSFLSEFYTLYSLFYLDLAVLSLLVVIAVYDLRHKIIPDLLVFLFGAMSLVRLFISSVIFTSPHFPNALDLLAGPVLALPIAFLWFVSGGKWIGLGDAKLALGIGWFLGFSLGVSALVLGFWFGAIVGVFLICLSKLSDFRLFYRLLLKVGGRRLTMKSEIPLAPFLILGLLVAYFFRIDVVGLSSLVIL